MERKILFQEQQKFTQWWLWLILIAPIGLLFYNLIKPIISHPSFAEGNYSFSLIPSYDFWISLLIMLLILILFFTLKLKTEITSDSIYIRYFPFFSKRWKWEDIQTAEVITYGFVGYEIRISFKYGIVYNVKGNQGLALNLKNGKKVMIGTQKPEELEQLFRGILK